MLIILGVYLGISCQPTSDKGTSGRVTVIEDSLMVPTYVVNPPNAMPRFYEGQAHQGVQRRYYPYPMNDNLTREKEDRNYKIIYLENEFIKIGVMPGLGGIAVSLLYIINCITGVYKCFMWLFFLR